MLKIFFISLIAVHITWALEYSDLIGDYRCVTKEDSSYNGSKDNIVNMPNFKNLILKFTEDKKFKIIDFDGEEQVRNTYNINEITVVENKLKIKCSYKIDEKLEISLKILVNKFSNHYLFTINDKELIFTRVETKNSDSTSDRYAKPDKSGYLREVKSMVWWGTGPCGLKKDKGKHGGVLVGCLYDYSPASISGLHLGDEIISIGDNKVDDWDIIREFIKKIAIPGKDFQLKVIRDDNELVFSSFMVTMDIESLDRMSESGKCKNFKME